jgi:hypothetical protein
MDWRGYIQFITEWADVTRFEATPLRLSEVGNVVFIELIENHYKADAHIEKNVMAVFVFNEANKIRQLDIYEQAADTGRWISEAAHAAAR